MWTTPVLSFRIGEDRLSINFLPGYSGFGFSLSRSIDERLAQIDAARTGLQSALTAVEELKEVANRNKADLDDALRRLQLAQESKAAAEREAIVAKEIAAGDVSAFRRVVGIPSRGQVAADRLIGFVLGVIASLLASLLWWLVTR